MEKPERQGLTRLGLTRLGLTRPGLTRRNLIGATAAVAGLAAAPVFAQSSDPFGLKGRLVQSGYATGTTATGGDLWVDGTLRGPVAKEGRFYVGFDRDAPATSTIEIRNGSGADKATLTIAPTTYDIQHVDGLPQNTVTPTDPVLLERIKREVVLKDEAFTSRLDADYFRGGFHWPLEHFVVSGHFGNQRILNGTPASPHMGFDMAAPTGTPIHAPQKGLVVLSETDLFYEGGLLLIDHGQGLISMYLHQSKVIARKGDLVETGQVIGEVGAKGRATGPHLCWRLKWTDRHMDPSLMVA